MYSANFIKLESVRISYQQINFSIVQWNYSTYYFFFTILQKEVKCVGEI